MKLSAVIFAAILLAGLSNCSRPHAQTSLITSGNTAYTVSTVRAPNIVSNGTVVDPTSIKSTDNLLKQGVGAWSNTVQGAAGGLTGGPTPAYNPNTDTIIFSYTQQQVAQQIAINQALQRSGLAVLGYSYSWQIGNYGQNSGTLTGVVDLKKGNTVLESFKHEYGVQESDFVSYAGLQPFSRTYPTSAVDSLSLTWTGQDATFWAGYWGPRVRTPSLGLVYGTDLCYANPLTDPTCSGYAAAKQAQMCTANPLSDPSCPGYQAAKNALCSANPLSDPTCPGYAAALKTQMCTANPLSDPSCPGYDQAYLNAQCIKDSLYSTKCEGYKTAYAIKYLIPNIDSSAVNQSLSSTAATAASNPTSVNTNGTVTTTPSTTGNTTVDSVISTPTTTSVTSTTSINPSANNSVITPNAPAGSPMNQAMNTPQNNGQQGPQNNQQGPQNNQQGPQGGQQQANQAQGGQQRKEQPNKEQQQEKQKEAVNANNNAKTMDQQKAAQNALIASMGAVVGFDAYSNVVIRDSLIYRPFEIYKNQANVDNRRNSYGLFGPSDQQHNEMVSQQYKLGE
jgi:hypothetical protein